MGTICFVIGAILFAVAGFDGHIGELELVPLGLMFLSIGHIVGSGWPGRRS